MYRARLVDDLLERRLRAVGAVVIEGPKACGKTETARRASASEVLLDVDRAARDAIDVDPALVLGGATPRLLDEWQLYADVLWDSVRREVDRRRLPGQFVLTGSAVPEEAARRHSGAGRFASVRMRTMSTFELGRSDGTVSLTALFDGAPARSVAPALEIADIATLVCVGGWPGNLDLPVADAVQANRDYLVQTCEVDVSRVGGTRRDPHRVANLVRALARHTATEASRPTLAADASGDDPMAKTTVDDYLDVLSRMLLVEDQPAWNTHLRSRAALRKAPKRHFVDPSLAAAALDAGPERLLEDVTFLGFLFESMVVRDLRVLSQPLDGTVSHYRDAAGLEIDAIVELRDGRWGAVEVKLGSRRIDDGAAALNALQAKVDTSKRGAPSFLAVVTGRGPAYRRADGVDVIPIGTLGP